LSLRFFVLGANRTAAAPGVVPAVLSSLSMRFLFPACTLFVMALTLAAALARFRLRPHSRWFLLYYLVVLGFSLGFQHSLNTWWLCVGVGAGALLRFAGAGPGWIAVRAVELVFFGYVLWRGLGLLLGW
jgi:hypothetical protein